MRNAFGMADSICNRDGTTLRQTVQCEIEACCIDDRFEVADKIFKANIRDLAI